MIIMEKVKIAIMQLAPVFNNLEASLAKATAGIEQAAAAGADMVVFGESWLCGYPMWIDSYSGASLWENEKVKNIFLEMHQNAMSISSPAMSHLCQMAKNHKLSICLGFTEKVTKGPGNGTLFNSMIIIGPEGKILNHHRKLVPTFNEKLVYGSGDAWGLKTVDLPWGTVGGLICWEHWMPLSRQALHNENETIHLSLWPTLKDMHQIASRHYAFEGRCFVIAVGQVLRKTDIPEKYWPLIQAHENEWVLNGGSCIIDPSGNFLIEPKFNIEEIIYYTIEDLQKTIREKMTLDVTGHYNRWDIFDFNYTKKRV